MGLSSVRRTDGQAVRMSVSIRTVPGSISVVARAKKLLKEYVYGC